MKKEIGAALGFTVFVCAGIWLYTEWDNRRFEASLPKAPPPQTKKRERNPAGQARPRPEVTLVTENAATAPPRHDTELENSAPIGTELTETVANVSSDDSYLDSLWDTFLEETTADAINAGDIGEATEAARYDEEVVKAGFDDYNAYLAIDPEYAYQRLDDAFSEQYGDDSDVDIIVKTVRLSNEGTLTIDDAIYHTEAMIRLVSKISPPEAVQIIADHLEYLKESKQLALESGDEIEHQFNLRFHVGE